MKSNPLSRYFANLYRRRAASEPHARYGELNLIALPWFVPLAGLVVIGIAAEALPPAPAAAVVAVAVALIGAPALLGMIAAMAVFLFGGLRADAGTAEARSHRVGHEFYK